MILILFAKTDHQQLQCLLNIEIGSVHNFIEYQLIIHRANIFYYF